MPFFRGKLWLRTAKPLHKLDSPCIRVTIISQQTLILDWNFINDKNYSGKFFWTFIRKPYTGLWRGAKSPWQNPVRSRQALSFGHLPRRNQLRYITQGTFYVQTFHINDSCLSITVWLDITHIDANSQANAGRMIRKRPAARRRRPRHLSLWKHIVLSRVTATTVLQRFWRQS